MNSDEQMAVPAPLKVYNRENAAGALITLKTRGRVGDQALTCAVSAVKAMAYARLRPATGGGAQSV